MRAARSAVVSTHRTLGDRTTAPYAAHASAVKCRQDGVEAEPGGIGGVRHGMRCRLYGADVLMYAEHRGGLFSAVSLQHLLFVDHLPGLPGSPDEWWAMEFHSGNTYRVGKGLPQ